MPSSNLPARKKKRKNECNCKTTEVYKGAIADSAMNGMPKDY